MLRLQANTVHALLKKNISLETPLGVELRQTPIIQIEFIIFSQILKCIKRGRNFLIFQFINLKHFEEIERLLLKHVQILQKQFSEQSVFRSQQSSNKETLSEKKKRSQTHNKSYKRIIVIPIFSSGTVESSRNNIFQKIL